MKYKIDVRYKTRTLKFRCTDSCSLGSKPEAVAADAGTTSSPYTVWFSASLGLE